MGIGGIDDLKPYPGKTGESKKPQKAPRNYPAPKRTKSKTSKGGKKK